MILEIKCWRRKRSWWTSPRFGERASGLPGLLRNSRARSINFPGLYIAADEVSTYLRLRALKVTHQHIRLNVPLHLSKVVIMNEDHVALVSLLHSPHDDEEHTAHIVGTHFRDVF